MRNLDDEETSPFNTELPSSELHYSLKRYADIVIEKRTLSAFFQTELHEKLEQLGVDHLFITGFNTEFCCQFTAIAS
ncbi:isochorismatase family protein [Psychrobacillus sp.]|uniref:cysteine hydrolase family protein n=1 Tax=Psychrobacillus sp. TaxID=1871623 RepID=UPI0028BDB28C|nr:isochorismatase family protein [Psychrobacillus sp.]